MASPALEFAFRHRSSVLVLALAPLLWACLALPAPSVPELAGGAALVLIGGAWRLAGIRRLGKRARVSVAGAEKLSTAGPYGRVRNPLYVAAILVVLGAGLLVGLGPWAPLPALVVWAVYDRVVRHEEGVILATHGAYATEYFAAVPRWIPRIFAAPSDPEPCVPWGEVLGREWRLLLGLPALIGVALALAAGPGEALRVALADLPVPWLVGVAAVVGAVGNSIKTEHSLRRRERRRVAQAAARAAAGVASDAPQGAESEREAAPGRG